jgi:hypothetical protein
VISAVVVLASIVATEVMTGATVESTDVVAISGRRAVAPSSEVVPVDTTVVSLDDGTFSGGNVTVDVSANVAVVLLYDDVISGEDVTASTTVDATVDSPNDGPSVGCAVASSTAEIAACDTDVGAVSIPIVVERISIPGVAVVTSDSIVVSCDVKSTPIDVALGELAASSDSSVVSRDAETVSMSTVDEMSAAVVDGNSPTHTD